MTLPSDAWMHDGTPRPCENDPELWFSKTIEDKQKAIKACAGCPLLVPCRAYALAQQPSHGIWGGLTETGRRKVLAGPPGCGTLRAYQSHRAKHEQCTVCEDWRAMTITAERRSRLADEHAKGGTRTGARIHLRLGEPACRACASAAYRERVAELASRPPRQRRRAVRARTNAA